jgi:hypothetical protein
MSIRLRTNRYFRAGCGLGRVKESEPIADAEDAETNTASEKEKNDYQRNP